MSKKSVKSILAISITVIVGLMTMVMIKSQQKVSPLPSDQYSYEMSTEELLAEFAKSELTATRKYMDKILKIDGIVETFDQRGSKSIIEFTSADPTSSVSCTVVSQDSSTDLLSGSHITVVARCTGYLMGAVLENGTLVN